MNPINESVLDTDIHLFFNNIVTVLKNYGAKAGLRLLNHSIDNIEDDTFPVEKANFILEVVANELGVNKQQISVKGIHGKPQDAKQIYFCLLKFHLKLSNRKLAEHLRITHTSINHATQRFEKLNTKLKVDKEFLEYYEKCDAIITKSINFK